MVSCLQIVSRRYVQITSDCTVQATENPVKMLRISLYVVHDFINPENKFLEQVPYGSGVRLNKLYGKADLGEVMAFEMQERSGRTLITGKCMLLYAVEDCH